MHAVNSGIWPDTWGHRKQDHHWVLGKSHSYHLPSGSERDICSYCQHDWRSRGLFRRYMYIGWTWFNSVPAIVHSVAVGEYTYTCNSIHWCKPGYAWLIFIPTCGQRKYPELLITCTYIIFRVQECRGYLCTVLLNTGCEDITGPHTDNYNCWGRSHFICCNTHVYVDVQHDYIYMYWGFLSLVTCFSSTNFFLIFVHNMSLSMRKPAIFAKFCTLHVYGHAISCS